MSRDGASSTSQGVVYGSTLQVYYASLLWRVHDGIKTYFNVCRSFVRRRHMPDVSEVEVVN